jgi:hypothetical protein
MTMQIPEQHLNKADGAAVGTAVLAFFKVIPWPEIAAFLAAVYTFLRLVDYAVSRVMKWWGHK